MTTSPGSGASPGGQTRSSGDVAAAPPTGPAAGAGAGAADAFGRDDDALLRAPSSLFLSDAFRIK
jgi:hypothetical protein